jgi:hypothetical protein
MVKQATTTAIPGSELKPWICNIIDERSAIPMLDAAIANQENDLPRGKPISMLSATNKMTVVIQSPCQRRPHGVHLLAFSSCGDLSLRAKHLFDAAMVAGLHAAPP